MDKKVRFDVWSYHVLSHGTIPINYLWKGLKKGFRLLQFLLQLIYFIIRDCLS